VITWAKRGDVHSRRLAIAKLGDKQLVAEIFKKVEQGLFKDRPGGYSRIMRLGKRRGDSATIVIMELVQEPCVKKVRKTDEEAKSAKRLGRRAAVKAEDKSKGKKKDEALELAETVDEAAIGEEDTESLEDIIDVEAIQDSAEETPAEDAPADAAETPAEDAPSDAEETPAEDAPADAAEAPTEAPSDAEETSAEQEAPAAEIPTEDEAPA
jgi:large subunit ribosomal protein L17